MPMPLQLRLGFFIVLCFFGSITKTKVRNSTTLLIKKILFSAFIVLFLAFGNEARAAGAASGNGTYTVAPTTASANTSQDYTFTFGAGGKNWSAGAQLSVVIPAGWSAPQTSNATGAGYLTVTLGSGTSVSVNSITGVGPWTVLIDFDLNNTAGSFTMNYVNAKAPSATGTSTFTTQTKISGGTLTNIATQPIVTVSNFTWTGSVNTDWSTTGNWGGGAVPAAANDILIPSGLTNYPIIGNAVTGNINNLFIETGASISATGTGKLQLNGTAITVSSSGTTSATISCPLVLLANATFTVEDNATAAIDFVKDAIVAASVAAIILQDAMSVTVKKLGC